MGNSIRWTEEQLAEFRAKCKVRTHRIKDDPDEERNAQRRVKPEGSKLEQRFDQQLRANKMPEPERNYFFLTGRNFELDRAWPDLKIAVEVQGMAHRIKGKFKRDIEKRALAMLAGWRVLEVDGAAIRDGRAIAWIKQLLGGMP